MEVEKLHDSHRKLQYGKFQLFYENWQLSKIITLPTAKSVNNHHSSHSKNHLELVLQSYIVGQSNLPFKVLHRYSISWLCDPF